MPEDRNPLIVAIAAVVGLILFVPLVMGMMDKNNYRDCAAYTNAITATTSMINQTPPGEGLTNLEDHRLRLFQEAAAAECRDEVRDLPGDPGDPPPPVKPRIDCALNIEGVTTAFGEPITATTPEGVIEEMSKRAACRPATLVQWARDYRIATLTRDDAHALAVKLRDNASNGDFAEWDALHGKVFAFLNDRLAKSKASITTLKPGWYGSLQMVAHPSGVPVIMDFSINRKENTPREVLQITFDDGTKAYSRLFCGGQDQKPLKNKKSAQTRKAELHRATVITKCVDGSTPNSEGNCPVVKKVKSAPTKESTKSPTTGPSTEPTTEPTTGPSTEPKAPGEDINANPAIPEKEKVKPTQKAEPDQAQPSKPAPAPTTTRVNPPAPDPDPAPREDPAPPPPPEDDGPVNGGDPVAP